MSKLTRQDIYDTARELSNWGRWGEDDEIGTLNNISPEDVVAALTDPGRRVQMVLQRGGRQLSLRFRL